MRACDQTERRGAAKAWGNGGDKTHLEESADRGCIRLTVTVVARSDVGTGLAQPEFGRTEVEARSQDYWLGVHEPLLPVDEFANRVEVSGVAGGLGDHVEQDIPKVVQAPLTLREGPPGRVVIWG